VQRQTKDGRTIDLRQTMAPIGGDGDRADAVMIVFEDITERRRMDQELRDAQRLDQIGRLAGGVAHDFNNLLAVIIAESEMALGPPKLDEESRQAFGDVLSAAKAGSELTRQLLSFARRRPVEPVAIDPNDLIKDVERMFRRLIGERVTLKLDLQAGV